MKELNEQETKLLYKIQGFVDIAEEYLHKGKPVPVNNIGTEVITPAMDLAATLNITKTFAKIFRATVDEHFSARGIKQAYGVSFYTFMNRMPVYCDDPLSYKTLYCRTGMTVNIIDFAKQFIQEIKTKFKMNEKPQFEEIPSPFEVKVHNEAIKEATEEIAMDLQGVTEEQVSEEDPGEEKQKEKEPENEFLEPQPVPEEKGPGMEVTPDQVHTQFMLNIPVGQIFEKAVADHINNGGGEKIANEARAIIEQEVAKMRPNYVQVGKASPVEITGTLHKRFDISLKLLASERQIFLSGPAGSGKTTLGEQLAEALQVRFAHISCTAGMSEAHLLGRMVADGTYIQSEFVDLYENGGVFLFDEIDAADANTLLIINSALANGRVSVPNRKDKPYATRHAEFYAVCAGNTWGRGSSEYNGRMLLDAAFLDRFAASKVEVNYDSDLEKQILSEFPDAYKALNQARENIKKNQLRRIISTRAYGAASRLLQVMSFEEFTERLTEGWAKEEREKVFPARKKGDKKGDNWFFNDKGMAEVEPF